MATQRLASAGRPAPLVNVQIMDEHGALLPTNERGEIVVRSSLVMAGYYKDPEATAQASRHGWHHTGDVGYLDDEGYLFIVDRLKDMIITGGFNVYSAEVEQALMQHPAVRDCAVIGLPDEKWGERVEAVVELKPGADVAAPDLIAFVKERIGSVKAPKRIELWPELPRSRVGKVLKTDVRAELLGERASPDGMSAAAASTLRCRSAITAREDGQPDPRRWPRRAACRSPRRSRGCGAARRAPDSRV